MPIMRDCLECHGRGYHCHIVGTIYLSGLGGPYAPDERYVTCSYCGGAGEVVHPDSEIMEMCPLSGEPCTQDCPREPEGWRECRVEAAIEAETPPPNPTAWMMDRIAAHFDAARRSIG